MRREILITSAAALALVATACNRPQNSDSEETQLVESEASANQEVLDASDASGAEAAFFASTSGGSVAGCNVTKTVIATQTACGASYPSQVQLTWDCQGPNGGTAHGTADIATAITPDQCPATQIAIAQTIGYDRVRDYQALEGELKGTASVDWNVVPGQATATKQVSLALEHTVTKNGNLIRHQTLDGNKTVQLDGNQPGPADDERVANGALDVKFLLAGDELNATETDLTFHRDCCYPIAGTIAWTKSGNVSGGGSVTFGPSCGEAVNADGDSLDLSECSTAP